MIVDFGQLGDVVLSLPALSAIRHRFPHARISVFVAKIPSQVVELAEVADEIIAIDKAEYRRRHILWSAWQIVRLIASIRRKKFDLIIDLHSLYETNIFAFLSGAKHRLLASRGNRSLDFLTNFEPKPPAEDRSMHVTERYFDVLKPLGINGSGRVFRFAPRETDVAHIKETYFSGQTSGMVGMFPGAGNPSRCWSLEKFGALTERMHADGLRPVVFLGPEENALKDKIVAAFPEDISVCEKLTIPQLAAALSLLDVFIVNDTGPLHIAAAVGTPSVVLLHEAAPIQYMPLSERLFLIKKERIANIEVDEVYKAVTRILKSTLRSK